MKLTLTSLTLHTALVASVLACGGSFYEPPPPLSRYHERIPVKTTKDLLTELLPAPAESATVAELQSATEGIMRRCEQVLGARSEIMQDIDIVLERNRTGAYRKRYANVLWDLKDLLDNPEVTDAEISQYARWRAPQLATDDGSFCPRPARTWDQNAEDYEQALEDWRLERLLESKELFTNLEQSSLALRPHWQVQAGARHFCLGDFSGAIQHFNAVLANDHIGPRAEVAQLMLGRCHLEICRSRDPMKPDLAHVLVKNAEEAFDAYLQRWPQGRYALDIPGWRAGLARLMRDWSGFIQQLAQQFDDVKHPEIIRRAAQELERGLAEMAKDEQLQLQPEVWNSLATRPILAMRMLGFVLDAQATDDIRARQRHYWESLTDTDVTSNYQVPIIRLRTVAQAWLPLLAEAVNRHQPEQADVHWTRRQRLILAWSCSEMQLHTQALRLLREVPTPSDEVLFARVIIYARHHQLKDSTTAAEELLSLFPHSPYAAETQFRLVMNCKDARDWAGALKALDAYENGLPLKNEIDEPSPIKAGERPARLRLSGELQQWRESILTFAPLPIVSAYLKCGGIARQRHLAADDFAGALATLNPKYSQEEQNWSQLLPQAHNANDSYGYPELPENFWRAAVTRLAKLEAQAKQTKRPNEKAKLLMAMATEWEENRGHLTMPMINERPRNILGQAGCLKLHNAAFLGIPEAEAGTALDSRDELAHAQKLWLQVADLVPGMETAATALEFANESLRRMAELHDTSYQRAYERNATQESRKIYDRLKKDYPKSAAARRAVWWKFPAPGEVTRLPNNNAPAHHEESIVRALCGLDPVREPQIHVLRPYEEAHRKTDLTLAVNLDDFWQPVLQQAATASTAEMLTLLESKRTALLNLDVSYPDYVSILNNLNDLVLFYSTPEIPDAERVAYLDCRIGAKQIPLSPPNPNSPAASFYAFLRILRLQNGSELTEAEQVLINDHSATEEPEGMCFFRDFLRNYPKSPKREAALTRITTSMVAQSFVGCQVTNLDWPQSPRYGKYVHPTIIVGAELTDRKAAAIQSLLDQYRQEYPQGQFATDVHVARSLVCFHRGQFEEGIGYLINALADPSKPDLHRRAAVRLAYAFMQLLTPEHRMSVVAGLRKHPASQRFLKRFMHSNTCGARLQLLSGWLATELAK